MDNKLLPKWLYELKRFQALKRLFFIYGNIYDSYYFPSGYPELKAPVSQFHSFDSLKDLLSYYLIKEKFEVTCYFDMIDGFSFQSNEGPLSPAAIISMLKIENKDAQQLLNRSGKGDMEAIDAAAGFFREIVKNHVKSSACILNFASRITSSPNALEDQAKPVFLKLLKAAEEATVVDPKTGKRNIIILLCDRLNDIPAWLLFDNPLTRGIAIQKPAREERSRFYNDQKGKFFEPGSEAVQQETGKLFPDWTENFSNRELASLVNISIQEQMPAHDMKAIIDLLKYGEKESPWETITKDKVATAAERLADRVLGQPKAISKAVEIIKRAQLGLDSIDKSGPSNKPKGVLFLAGPTGTGKTELAKAIADLIFEDEEAIIRFDMSEYSDSNSDVKLIGSPPGYVGYDEGGQLTDAVKKKPFCVLLFDEMDKAHPKIFDKFLQILDDGRLTDGKGETVYFAQSLIIFTSNLGIFTEDEQGRRVANVAYDDSPEELEEKIKTEIKLFFGNKLGRPEILNRFGDNFVVFNFISPKAAADIIEKRLKVIKINLEKLKKIHLVYDASFHVQFLKICEADSLEMGGRGIINKIESLIKKELTNFIFLAGDQVIRIKMTVENNLIKLE